MLKYFKNISIFKVDLGFNIKGPANDRRGKGEPTIKIRDEFVKKYQTLNSGRFTRKYGEIGTLKFYEDSNIERNEFHIYDGDKVYEIEATQEDLDKDPGTYLTEILQMIEDGPEEIETENSEGKIKDISYSNMPEDMERPNMKLNPNNPAEKQKYLDLILSRRRLLEKTK
jgi:hypothetical protein